MEETKSGLGVIWVLFVILVIWAILGGNCSGFVPEGGCGRVSNCQIEKNEIIDSARTQFLIEQNGAATRTAVRDSTDAVMAQNSRIYEQRLQETIFDLKMGGQAKDAKIAQLEGQIYTKALVDDVSKQLNDCCCAFNRRLDSIECNMLTKPSLYGVAATCTGQTIPGGFNLRNSCNNGCGNNRSI